MKRLPKVILDELGTSRMPGGLWTRGQTEVVVAARRLRFDMVTMMRTPTCVNYRTVMNAIHHLTPQGLRRVWVVTPKAWLADIARWHAQVWVVDEDNAVEGVSRAGIEWLLDHYGFRSALKVHNGRATPGWYLVQLVNLGFVLRKDVLEVLLVHDADQIVLPSLRVFSSILGNNFVWAGHTRPKFLQKVGGDEIWSYARACACIIGQNMAFHGVGATLRGSQKTWAYRIPHTLNGSFVTHSFTVFRPFMLEMLNIFASSRKPTLPGGRALAGAGSRRGATPRPSSVREPAGWVIEAIRCINKEKPKLGFSEISTYATFVLTHHPDAFEIQKSRTWQRNPTTDEEWAGLFDGEDLYCCRLDPLLNRYAERGFEYLGLELGHSIGGVGKGCGYTSNMSFFQSSPYPPAKHPFWASRGISFD